MSSSHIDILIAVPLLLLLGAATLTDWRERRIPNVLTFSAIPFALVLQATISGWPGLVSGMLGAGACLVCFIPFYLSGGMAAGDVKLMAAVGAFVGPAAGLTACAFTLLAGGLIGAASIVSTWSTRVPRASGGDSESTFAAARQARIPYAGAIATGTSVILLVPTLVPTTLSTFGG